MLTCSHLSQMSFAAPKTFFLYFTCKQIMECEVCFNRAYSFNTFCFAAGRKNRRERKKVRCVSTPSTPPAAATTAAAEATTPQMSQGVAAVLRRHAHPWKLEAIVKRPIVQRMRARPTGRRGLVSEWLVMADVVEQSGLVVERRW